MLASLLRELRVAQRLHLDAIQRFIGEFDMLLARRTVWPLGATPDRFQGPENGGKRSILWCLNAKRVNADRFEIGSMGSLYRYYRV